MRSAISQLHKYNTISRKMFMKSMYDIFLSLLQILDNLTVST